MSKNFCEVLNSPNLRVDCINKSIYRRLRYITNFLYQKNIISLHDLPTKSQVRRVKITKFTNLQASTSSQS